jgi:hypothetical protein
MKKSRLAAVATGVVLAVTAQLAAAAKGPEYTYAELGYIHLDSDSGSGDGGGANISFGATDHVFLKFGYSKLRVKDDVTSISADADRFEIGAGGHYAITDTIDLLGSLSYVDVEYSHGVPAFGDDGYLAEVGVRAMVTKDLELNGRISQLHLNNNDTGLGIGAVYKLTKDWSATGSFHRFQDDNEDEYFLGVRLNM